MKRLMWAMALVIIMPISAALPEAKGKGTPGSIAMSTEQYEKMLAALNKLEEFKAEMQAFNAALKPIQDHLNEISSTLKQVKTDVEKHSTQLSSLVQSDQKLSGIQNSVGAIQSTLGTVNTKVSEIDNAAVSTNGTVKDINTNMLGQVLPILNKILEK